MTSSEPLQGCPQGIPGAQTRDLRGILARLPDGVVVTDPEGRFLLFNEAAQAILGIGATDGAPASWPARYGLFGSDKITPFPLDRLPLIRALHGEAVGAVEMFVRNPCQPRGGWISVSATPWKDASGRLLGAIAVLQDVTARREAEESIRRLSNAVEQAADGIMITDRMGTILDVNPAFEVTSGYTKAELLGRTPRILKSGTHDKSFYDSMWATLLAGEVFRGALVNRKKSGELYHAEQTISPIRDTSGTIAHFVTVTRDVTSQREGAERERELKLAARVQQHLYPHRIPRFPGVDIAGAAQPATAMCGDYYDYFAMSKGRLGLVIADVCGHGLGPALTMVGTRAALRSAAIAEPSVHRILDRVNRTLVADLESGAFVTMLLVALDCRAPSLTYSNAAHPSGLVLDSTGRVRHTLESTRIPLGIMDDTSAQRRTREIALDAGDIIVLLTDGILETEEPDGTSFGAERVLTVIGQHRAEPAQRVLHHLLRSVRDFRKGGHQADDLTAVVCKMVTV